MVSNPQDVCPDGRRRQGAGRTPKQKIRLAGWDPGITWHRNPLVTSRRARIHTVMEDMRSVLLMVTHGTYINYHWRRRATDGRYPRNVVRTGDATLDPPGFECTTLLEATSDSKVHIS